MLLALAGILALPLAAGDEGLGRARFTWDPVEDPIVCGYKVHWGTASGVYNQTADAGNATELIVAAFSDGVEYFAAVTAYSAAGEESDYSTEINFVYDTSNLVITVTSQPQAQTVTAGQTASFTVAATGAGTLTYQWRKDGTSITDATLPTYGIASAVMADAGSYTVEVTNAAGSTTSDAAILTVNPVTPVITAVPVAATISYGQTLAEATLTGGSASVAGTFTFASPLSVPTAGTANQTVIFTPTDTANYIQVTVEVGVTVYPVTPVITAVPVVAPISYGQTLAEATLTGGSASVAGTFTFASPLSVPNAGTANQTVIFTPADTANYTQATVEVGVTVNPATPVITAVPVAATISYGQTLAEATLTGGSASVAGVFAFASPSTVPNAGTANQTVIFTAADTANYIQSTTEVSVTVNPATPVILAVPVASTIRYGQTLAESTLSGGSASVAGTFAFANPSTVPIIGTTYHPVIFTAADSANYHTVTVLVAVKVLRKRPTAASLGVTQDFASWIGNFVGAGGATAPGDDPDGDGISNLMEYALADGSPDLTDREILPVVSIMTDGDQQYLAMTVRKNPYTIGISWLVEVSGNLVDWNTGSSHTVVVSDTPDTLIVRDNTPMAASASRFLRLKVSAAQP